MALLFYLYKSSNAPNNDKYMWIKKLKTGLIPISSIVKKVCIVMLDKPVQTSGTSVHVWKLLGKMRL